MFRRSPAVRGCVLLSLVLLAASACSSSQHGSPAAAGPAAGPKDYPAIAESDYVISNCSLPQRRNAATAEDPLPHHRDSATGRLG